MPRSQSFKPCASCHKPIPVSDPLTSCLKCLGETHVQEQCRICRRCRSRTKKDRDTRFKFFLMQAVFCPPSELSHGDLALSTLTSMRSSLASLREAQCSSASPALRKDSAPTARDSQHRYASPAPTRNSQHCSPLPMLRKKAEKDCPGAFSNPKVYRP